MHLMRARQQLLAFLLRHGRTYTAGKYWTQRHRLWLSSQTFEQHAYQIVFQDYVEAVWTAQERRDALIVRMTEMIKAGRWDRWSKRSRLAGNRSAFRSNVRCHYWRSQLVSNRLGS